MLDAGGCVVAPGLVDLHAHLREPGAEESETIETGSRAAALGGYTAVVAMPNTEPAADSAAVVRHVLDLAKGACCDVCPAGTITVGRQGKVLAPMAEMAALGVRIFTDDGDRRRRTPPSCGGPSSTPPASGVVVADHCEEASLVGNGCMNEGDLSSRLGLPGRPAVAEEVMVRARPGPGPASPVPVSTCCTCPAPQSVAAVRQAKAAGVAVTAEVTPHHLVLTEDAVWSATTPCSRSTRPCARRPTWRRSAPGLADGTIDAIATDHAPHPPEAKQVAFCEAAPGHGRPRDRARAWLSGELGLPVERVLALMSWQPAAIAGLSGTHGGPVTSGRAGQPVRDRPRAALGSRAGGAGEPQPQHALCRPGARRARSATRSWPASRSSSARRRSDDRR